MVEIHKLPAAEKTYSHPTDPTSPRSGLYTSRGLKQTESLGNVVQCRDGNSTVDRLNQARLHVRLSRCLPRPHLPLHRQIPYRCILRCRIPCTRRLPTHSTTVTIFLSSWQPIQFVDSCLRGRSLIPDRVLPCLVRSRHITTRISNESWDRLVAIRTLTLPPRFLIYRGATRGLGPHNVPKVC